MNYRLQSFQKKLDVSAVMIVFDSRGMHDSGSGYKHPSREVGNTERFCHVIGIPQVSLRYIDLRKNEMFIKNIIFRSISAPFQFVV